MDYHKRKMQNIRNQIEERESPNIHVVCIIINHKVRFMLFLLG